MTIDIIQIKLSTLINSTVNVCCTRPVAVSWVGNAVTFIIPDGFE